MNMKKLKIKVKDKQNKKTPLRVFFDVLGYFIFCLIFILVVVVGYQSVSGQQPQLFSYCIYYIETDSMVGDYDNSFSSKSVIISKLVDEDDCYNLKVGDVITFAPKDLDLPSYVSTKTHRIVEIDYNNKTIITKGDANTSLDAIISFSDVHARLIKVSPILTKLIGLLKSFWGFLLFIFIPLMFLIVLQIYSFFLEKKKLEYEKEANKLEEEQKKKIADEAIKEYLESLNNKNVD